MIINLNFKILISHSVFFFACATDYCFGLTDLDTIHTEGVYVAFFFLC